MSASGTTNETQISMTPCLAFKMFSILNRVPVYITIVSAGPI